MDQLVNVFEQPFYTPSNVKPDCVCELKQGYYYPQFNTPYRKFDLRLWCKVYNQLVRLNEETKRYVETEYNSLFLGGGLIISNLEFLV